MMNNVPPSGVIGPTQNGASILNTLAAVKAYKEPENMMIPAKKDQAA